jgi:hypothetical protein
MEEARLHDMRIIPTIETIPLSGKKVRQLFTHSWLTLGLTWNFLPVCVSSLMVDEIKRIIKTSEIMKYISRNPKPFSVLTVRQGRR